MSGADTTTTGRPAARTLRMGEITDGQSNTILVGEKHLIASEILSATSVGNDGHAYNGDKGHSLRNMSTAISRTQTTAASCFVT